MNESAFEELLDTHGANVERWPHATREAAEALLASSPRAQASHARAIALAAVLDRLTVAEANDRTSRDRVLARLPNDDWLDGLFGWITGGRWGLRPAAVAMLPLLVGVWLGMAVAPPAQEDDLTNSMSMLALDLIEEYTDVE